MVDVTLVPVLAEVGETGKAATAASPSGARSHRLPSLPTRRDPSSGSGPRAESTVAGLRRESSDPGAPWLGGQPFGLPSSRDQARLSLGFRDCRSRSHGRPPVAGPAVSTTLARCPRSCLGTPALASPSGGFRRITAPIPGVATRAFEPDVRARAGRRRGEAPSSSQGSISPRRPPRSSPRRCGGWALARSGSSPRCQPPLVEQFRPTARRPPRQRALNLGEGRRPTFQPAEAWF